MAYRGEDLDLRTPHVRGTRDPGSGDVNGSRQRGSAGRSSEPTWVDETVLACCNHAYDVAQAHGASEVRLEHLVHALTRVETAAEILEERGIREAHLRRESAAVIASEIPVGLARSHSAPRSSAEFEDVLRRASDHAAPRGVAADVHDLLWVLLNYNRDIPAIALLLRHAADWQQWDWPNRRERVVEVRREEVPPRREPRREVVREVVREVRPAPRYADRRQTYVEARPRPDVQTVSYAPPPVTLDLEPVHHRLDQLEQSLRRLQDDISVERREVADLLREVRDDVLSGKEVNIEFPSHLTDRFDGVERSIEQRLESIDRSITDRIKGLDKSLALVSTQGSDTSLTDLVTEQLVTVTDRLQALENAMQSRSTESQRIWSTVGDRLKALDETLVVQRQELQRAAASTAAPMQTLLNDRFQSLAQFVQDQNQEMGKTLTPVVQQIRDMTTADQQSWRALSDRMDRLENVLRVQAEQTVTVQQTHERDLNEVHEALLKIGANQQTLAESMDQWRLESDGGFSIIANRLGQVEQTATRPLELLTQVQSDIQGLQQVTLADYDKNRRGWKNWLFGTDEVFAKSWFDETAQVRARLRQLRERRQQNNA
jgi:hypothetical protein